MLTKAGKAYISDIFAEEKKAEVSNPNKLIREKFELQYPSNWKVAVNDEKYDPDHMFSIESPGTAFAMFVIAPGETNPEDTLQLQIQQFMKIMTSPAIDKFERYGRFSGKGAIMKGKVMGSGTTMKVFAFSQNHLTVAITQSRRRPKAGAGRADPYREFIFAHNQITKETPDKPAAGDGK